VFLFCGEFTPEPMLEACAVADKLGTLLQLLVPAAVHRAERATLTEESMRTLLEFHQDIVSPVSAAFAFAIPCGKALRAIARHCHHDLVVEPGAGNGLWAFLLRRAGIAVDAFDIAVPVIPFSPVRVGCCEAQSVPCGSDGAALFLCWPPLELEAAFGGQGSVSSRNLTALHALRAFVGDTLLYIGEWRGHAGLVAELSERTSMHGHTAGEAFQAEVSAEWVLLEVVRLPRWPGFADALFIFRRRGADKEDEEGDRQATRRETCCSTDSSRSGGLDTNGGGGGGGGGAATAGVCAGDECHTQSADAAERVRVLLASGLQQPVVLAAACLLADPFSLVTCDHATHEDVAVSQNDTCSG
jgi:hypothetical protein